MRRKLKGNKEISEALIPKSFAVGCRRPTPGEGFLEALVAPITTVHTKQMQRVTETGFIAHDGTPTDVDVIICATGFDTSWVPRFPIRVAGRNLQDAWREGGALSYLGVAVPEIPNYFLSIGPVSQQHPTRGRPRIPGTVSLTLTRPSTLRWPSDPCCPSSSASPTTSSRW